jgi:predicted component of type VI protein secretion system
MDKEPLLKALLDLRMALGELQVVLSDIDRAINNLMKVELDIKGGNPES